MLPTLPLNLTTQDLLQWGKVNICEMGGGHWGFQGPIYSGGLGIRNTTWREYGGTRFAPSAGLANKFQQIYVAKIINRGYDAPDQYGCGHGW